MDVIAPLIRLDPCEVLINFMTDFIRRFIDCLESQNSFISLFGSSDFRDRLAGLESAERIDAIVDEYCRQLHNKGNYPYTCPAIVMHPDKERTHYHLIYATRHDKGVTVFKNAEKKAMNAQKSERAKVEKTKRESRGQRDLLFSDEPPPSEHYRELRRRYLDKAIKFWLSQLQTHSQLAYDKA